MSKLMLVNAGDDESRVAIVENGVLQDLHVESIQAGRTRGNIYKGTVVRVEPAIQSCFVDYGAERNGFLSNGDIAQRWWKKGAPDKKRARIEEVVAPGMHLMVQSVKEPEGRKGAALTTRISLPGRYLVFMPDTDSKGGVSRKIDDGAERTRLKKLMDTFCEQRDCSLIVRSVAAERTKAELERDLGYLVQLWKTILADFKESDRPGICFSEQDVVVRCIRDYFGPDVDRVLVDEPQAYKRALEYVRAAMPRHRKRFELYAEDVPLLLRHGVEAQIEEIYRKRVRLPSGGEIVIDPTEALVSIDVNSGKSMGARSMEETALSTNLEAAAEAARQLRLRDLGGLIVLDFIDMREMKNKKKVERAMKVALKDDKARHNIGRISQFGLLELSRQRLQGTVASASHEACPSCRGSGVLRSASSGAAGAIRRLKSLLVDTSVSHIDASLPRAAALYLLNEKRSAIAELEGKTGATISVIPTDLSPDEPGQFTPRRGERASVLIDVPDDEQIAAELAEAEALTEVAAQELEAQEALDEAAEKQQVEERAAARAAARQARQDAREARRARRIEEGGDPDAADDPEGESDDDGDEERASEGAGEGEGEGEGEGRPPRRRRRRRRGRRKPGGADGEGVAAEGSTRERQPQAGLPPIDGETDLPPIAGEEDEDPRGTRRRAPQGEGAQGAGAEGDEEARPRRRRRRGGRGRGRGGGRPSEGGTEADVARGAAGEGASTDSAAAAARAPTGPPPIPAAAKVAAAKPSATGSPDADGKAPPAKTTPAPASAKAPTTEAKPAAPEGSDAAKPAGFFAALGARFGRSQASPEGGSGSSEGGGGSTSDGDSAS